MQRSISIIGAGLTGLIAAHAFPRATVYEAMQEGALRENEHSALLRFRTDAVSRITGVNFRKVRVHKSIVVDGEHVAPNLRIANMYASKVTAATGGKLTGRSIMNVDSVDRFIAPPDFIETMRENVATRAVYSSQKALAGYIGYHAPYSDEVVISTMPMPVLLAGLPESLELPREGWAQPFHYAPISVSRYRLPGVDLHQTIYYPGGETEAYRASITGDVLIVECVNTVAGDFDFSLAAIVEDFGLPFAPNDVELIDKKVQKYGKIVDIDSSARRNLLRELTDRGRIYSLGRFATWRNILLDDVAKDIEVIRNMIGTDVYSHAIQFEGGSKIPF